ncbi:MULTISPECIES: amidase [Pseudonocardia]|uniref:Glutamyl-tRNA(Gln) amidotransferase subunit A n=1 Tax=Pseudonocardia autotrophica TaxID=2074 RepID=A0A1Y2MJK7_PSEAH|nr:MULTISPECIES: amidase [Pseudonocardia]OSY35443.1 Glutamyl-tRNA(Gln) amidotransferase subunit A [Pseudonocardia autotrophica]TDN72194.1 amidase [Pseudonocardia autotrophica]
MDLDLHRTDLAGLESAMASGRLTSARLTAFYTDRIATLDPQLGAVVAVDPTAAEQAAASDRRRAAGEPPRLLEGIPVLVKDNMSTGPQLPTTAGSTALARSRPPEATIATRLREAGAVLLGKTNLSEWSNFRSVRSSSGWSAVGGLTRNPHSPERTACGSSAGSAVAVAAALTPVAIGTETDGSIVCPAAMNGIVGMKPTLGTVSRTGIVPISAEQDTAGPMTRSVADAARVLAAIAGHDPADPVTAESAAHPVPVRPADRGLAGVRLGVFRVAEGASPETDAAFAATLEVLRGHGAVLVDPVELPGTAQAAGAELTALVTEFARDIDSYLRSPGVTGPGSLAELVDYNRRHAEVEMPHWGQELFEAALATRGDTDDEEYLAARETAITLSRRDLDAALTGHRLDAVIAPTNSPAWRVELGAGDDFVLSSSATAAVAGHPHITVPAGGAPDGDGGTLPLGVSLIGPRWADGDLLALAAAVQDALPERILPPLPPAVLPADG